MENIAAYNWGLIALLVFVLITLVQSALVGGKKAAAKLTAGSDPKSDYDSSLYRWHRAHQNAVENAALIFIALVACIFAGVSPWWVNLLMILFLVFRVAHSFILIQKIGAEVQSIRSYSYVAAWAVNIILAVMAIVALV